MIKTTFVPALIWLVVITGLSVTPGNDLPQINIISADKFAHAFVYGLLTWLILRGIWRSKDRTITNKQIALVVLFAAGWGVLMEFVQYAFVPGRFYEYADMLANAIGALLGWLIFTLFSRRR